MRNGIKGDFEARLQAAEESTSLDMGMENGGEEGDDQVLGFNALSEDELYAI